ncbi:hypothetical protein [Xylophilus sp. GOD-11R]|uniref:hypothetical protein n=1 Tax=Xylophilus sp. GOD-11R TaxID=3089814 RepID=UPI00298C1671|nr:hypothetical protein [Xylophilus sp. GOD-11R]WPB57002.1 hypothetical protein R9X41_23200 [Xylophilus sp. GOD-11R]
MTPLSDSHAIGLRCAMALAVAPETQVRHGVNTHAVMNLLNRCNGTEDAPTREELIARLADYLAAIHRVGGGPLVALSSLGQLVRSYAAMRYFMADAIEPRIDCAEERFRLRTEQAAAMAAFLQHSIDSLISGFVPRIHFSVHTRAWWRVELSLTISHLPDRECIPPSGWSRLSDGSGFRRSALFSARTVSLTPQ